MVTYGGEEGGREVALLCILWCIFGMKAPGMGGSCSVPIGHGPMQ